MCITGHRFALLLLLSFDRVIVVVSLHILVKSKVKSSTMREDKLAKMLFFVGCAGLPWLWAVHIMYFVGKQRQATASNNEEGLLDGESLATEEPGDPVEMALETKKWVRREFVGMVLVVFAWITWIIVFAILKDYFPAGWLVRGEDAAEYTGW